MIYRENLQCFLPKKYMKHGQFLLFYVDIHLHCCGPQNIKGTQDWEFFWLRFWNLHYFFVSYVKILRFYKKIFLIVPFLGGGTIFPRSPRTTRNEKKFWARSKNFFSSSSILGPKYDPILVFWKFNHLNAPGTTLCVDLGSKCKIVFPLVWD